MVAVESEHITKSGKTLLIIRDDVETGNLNPTVSKQFTAWVDEKQVATLLLELDYSNKSEPRAAIKDFEVCSERRRDGIGTIIFNEAMQFAEGSDIVLLTHTVSNPESIAFCLTAYGDPDKNPHHGGKIVFTWRPQGHAAWLH